MSPKLPILAAILGALFLMVVLLTHIGTYNVSLVMLSLQDTQATASPHTYQTSLRTPTPSTKSVLVAASSALERINQLDCSQYASQSECSVWAYSACSAAALTEVLNAYGHHYRITDILNVESAIGEITPELGLLEDAGIERTAARFHFSTTWGHTLTLTGVLAKANHGRPVIVSFPPDRYPHGHLVVVLGGSGDTVYLADSSMYDRHSLTRAQFMKWWGGFSAIVTPSPQATTYSVTGKNTLSVAFMNQVLASYHSPAAGKAQALYDDGVKYGLDSAYALAFFLHESSFGTTGVARVTLSLSNMRCVPQYPCLNENGGYAIFKTWEQGFEAWFKLIRTLYVDDWGRITIDQIIPKYAPNSDGNDEAGYIASLKHTIDTWRSGQVRV